MTRKDAIAARLAKVRERTLMLLEHVPEEFLQRRVHSFYSPIGWHFGHVGRTEDYWVCCATLGQPPCDERLDFLYTDRPDNPKDNRVHVPDRTETLAYLSRTRQRVLEALDRSDLEEEDPFLRDGYAWEFAIQHECQHQETICEMLCLIQREIGGSAPQVGTRVEGQTRLGAESSAFVALTGGSFQMGTDDPVAYDNEKDPLEVEVAPFQLARTPVTCREWSEFIADGGYRRPDLWSNVGWTWRQGEEADRPEYWLGQGCTYGPFGVRELHPDEPVLGISHHEAEAFARWAGARLPTETEWEYAARAGRYPWGDERPTETHARHGMAGWSPAAVGSHPDGISPDGVLDLAGNVWEWTFSRFLPYPGFVAFPYDGYSKDHMKGEHFVCRGGSWATAGPILRRTFRNWYVPAYRQGFLGVRLARD